MICRECGTKMILDDKDTLFKGYIDKYWYCEKCNAHCLEKIRFSQSFKEEWSIINPETDETIKEYTIKHKIDYNFNKKQIFK